MALTSFFEQNTWQAYLLALGIFIGGSLIIWGIKKGVTARFQKSAADEGEGSLRFLLWKLVNRIVFPFALYGIFYVAFSTLSFGPKAHEVVTKTGYVLVVFFMVRLVVNVIERMLYRRWLQEEQDELRIRSYQGIILIVKFFVWCAAFIFILDNLGFEVTTVITGLGIGGVAVALGAQAILGDLFSYFAILFDRPFRVNDFLIIDEHMGTVENIGIKTTRLRSISGEELVFPNSNITGARVKNYGLMEERRINFRFGVVYGTPREKLEKLPGILKNILDNIDQARFDRSHFSAFTDYSLICETIYYVESAEYLTYMDIQEKINLELKTALENEEIEFAFPTNRVYVHQVE